MHAAPLLPPTLRWFLTLAAGPVAKAAAGVMGLRLINIGLGFLTTILLTRALGAEGFGVFAFGVGLAAMLAFPARLGLDQLLIRETAALTAKREFGMLAGLHRFAFALALALSVLAAFGLAGFGWLSGGRGDPLGGAAVIAACALPAMTMTVMAQSAQRGWMQVASAYAPEFAIAPALTLALCAVMIFGGALTPDGALTAFTVAWGVAALCAAFLLARVRRLRLPPAKLLQTPARWLRASTAMMAATVSYTLFGRIEVVILALLAGPVEAGLYAAAFRFAQLATLPNFAVGAALGPHVSKLLAEGQRDAINRRAGKAVLATLAGAAAIVAGLLSVSFFALPWLGEQFDKALAPLAILCVGVLAAQSAGPVGMLMIMMHRAEAATRVTLLWASLSVIANLALAWLYGAVGAAAATAFCLAGQQIHLGLRLRREGVAIGAAALFGPPRRAG